MRRFHLVILSLLLISSAALAAGGSGVACPAPANDDTPAPKTPSLVGVDAAVASLANPLQVHCAGCHSGAGPMPPSFPFKDPKALAALFVSQPGLKDTIKKVINSTGPDRMPKGPALTADQIKDISSYMDEISAPAK